jgi:hypothetical protein
VENNFLTVEGRGERKDDIFLSSLLFLINSSVISLRDRLPNGWAVLRAIREQLLRSAVLQLDSVDGSGIHWAG